MIYSSSSLRSGFQSTLLMRGATLVNCVTGETPAFQSTLLMRGATRGSRKVIGQYSRFQSTLLMRGATSCRIADAPAFAFQSTLLMRGATSVLEFSKIATLEFQSTLLMRGATRDADAPAVVFASISIHAPHARSDSLSIKRTCACLISIHAPHARSDRRRRGGKPCPPYFNPRSSCEERLPTSDLGYHATVVFQSTLLMRGATVLASMAVALAEFQSTLLMRGATRLHLRPPGLT